jgi:CheY-like chemotaxis protein
VAISSVRILIVDDSKAFLGAARSLLESRGMHVVGSAGSGAEGLAAIPLVEPDLVLMDVHMPVMTGLEAVRTIKRIHPGIRVVLMSLEEQWLERHERAGGRAEADGFVNKVDFTDSCFAVIEGLFPHVFGPQANPDRL